MRLSDRNGLAGFSLPVLAESGVEFAVKLAGGIVGHVQQSHRLASAAVTAAVTTS